MPRYLTGILAPLLLMLSMQQFGSAALIHAKAWLAPVLVGRNLCVCRRYNCVRLDWMIEWFDSAAVDACGFAVLPAHGHTQPLTRCRVPTAALLPCADGRPHT